jgi:hypothetical protein
VAWTYDITPAPAVGDKITAAGFGAQADGSVAELQSAVDTITGGSAVAGATTYASAYTTNSTALLLHDWTRPGGESIGHTLSGPTSVTTGAGITTFVSAPAGGTTRVVKSVFIHSPTIASTAKLTLGSTTLGYISFPTGGVAELDCCIPLVSTDTNGLRVTMTGGTGYVTAGYADRADTTILRHALTTSHTSGTLLTAPGSGATRYVTSVWIGNTSTSTAAVTTLTIGAGDLLHSYSIAGSGIFILDKPIPVTNATTVTFTGDATNDLTYMLVGH